MLKIVSDSTCDLSRELLDRYDIGILPLNIVLGEESFQDGKDIGPDEIYAWSDEHNTTPKTSACSVEQAASFFKTYIDNGDEVICFAISESMSSSINSMRLAAKSLKAEDRITIIDSANLSTGVGLQVIEAAVMAQEGKTAAEVTSRIEELKPLVRASFVVDTLTYLHRGGRCSGMAALLGGALKLHPRIVVSGGKMSPDKKYRGKMNRIILHYAEDMEADLLKAKTDRVFITHSGCDEEVIQSVRTYLEGLARFDEILVTRAGGVISSHCGPGTLGVLFIAGE
ncbi:MAG: DegV family protein [Clostridiales bacterium]|nr:DegV family protein [Clostridiales bacterium]